MASVAARARRASSLCRSPRLREQSGGAPLCPSRQPSRSLGGSDWAAQMADESGFPDEGGNFPDRRFKFRARPQKIPVRIAGGCAIDCNSPRATERHGMARAKSQKISGFATRLDDRMDKNSLMTAPHGAPRRVNRGKHQNLLISLGGINTRNRPYHSSFSGDSRDRRIPYAGRYDRGTRHRHRREVVHCLALRPYCRACRPAPRNESGEGDRFRLAFGP